MSKKTFPPLRTADLADLLTGLLDRAEENLSDADLQALRLCGDGGVAMTEDLAALMSALAVQVAGDETPDGSVPVTGAFLDGRSLSKLLFSLSNLAQQANAMLLAARMAENMTIPHRRGHAARGTTSTQGVSA
ncbi:hypothetical protein [Ideonella oryzae]|uniref:DUF1641 domain-containing protein n=1 Tax=Ideonella oryzae TaxID=2937441 RepID=A0ABT1BN20_9BURK|nr:hypothetical protein [Ideonella oryzae]MCO5976797.1 hypothetical protein [Ideonella oryzae]